MNLFLATLIGFALCALALGVGGLLGGRPLEGGCAGLRCRAGACADCPHRKGERDGDGSGGRS